MTPIADHAGARRALRGYLAHAKGKLPADTFAQLEDFADSVSIVDQVAKTAELLFARRDELDDDGRIMVAQLASYAAVNGWHEMAVDNRGGMIAQAMKRETSAAALPGQPKPHPAKDDPAPRAQFKRPAPADDAAA